MEFAAFAGRAEANESGPIDLEIASLVVDCFEAAGEDLPVMTRFLQARVFPARESQTLDIGPNLCYEATSRAAGPNVSVGDVEDRLTERGEIGEVTPRIVFEVGSEEIQRSPMYSSAFALAFPRYQRVGDDKNPEDADTLR